MSKSAGEGSSLLKLKKILKVTRRLNFCSVRTSKGHRP